MKKKSPAPKQVDRRARRGERLVDKLLAVDDLKQVSGGGPSCRACAFRTA